MASVLLLLPDPLHQALRQASKKQGRPQYRLVIEAIAAYLRSLEGDPVAKERR